MERPDDRAAALIVEMLVKEHGTPGQMLMTLGNLEERSKYSGISHLMDSSLYRILEHEQLKVQELQSTCRMLGWGFGILMGIAGWIVIPAVIRMLG